VFIFQNVVLNCFSLDNLTNIGRVMVSVFTWSAVDRVLEPLSGQIKDCKHAEFSSKSKDWLGGNQDSVSDWRDMSTCRLLLQWIITTNPTKRVGPVQNGHHHHQLIVI